MTEIIRVSSFLRYILLADAATCLACGLLLTIGGGLLENILGLPNSLIFYAGLSLFAFVALLFWAATRKTISKPIIWLIIGLNLIWTLDSFLLLISGYVAPTTFGYVFVIFQAIGVLIFANLEFIGMRKSEVVVFKNVKETI